MVAMSYIEWVLRVEKVFWESYEMVDKYIMDPDTKNSNFLPTAKVFKNYLVEIYDLIDKFKDKFAYNDYQDEEIYNELAELVREFQDYLNRFTDNFAKSGS